MTEYLNTISRQVDRLPHFYRKEPAGNIYKVLFLPAEQVDHVYDAEELSKLWRLVIDAAQGVPLDHLGMNLQQYRGGDNDPDYRLWLHVKRIANLSKGEVESFNKALTLLMREAFLGIYETWGIPVYLNQEGSAGLILDGTWKLTGGKYFREPQEPAALVVEYCHETFYLQVGEFYRDIFDDRWYLNGKYYCYQEAPDGRLLDGGTFYHPGESLADMLVTTRKIRTMIRLIKAGGVGLYWKSYAPSTLPISSTATDRHEKVLLIKPSPGAITHCAFGNAGHDALGDPVDPTGLETEVAGEFIKVPIRDIQTIGTKTVIRGALDFSEGEDYNVSSIGIYDEHNDLVGICNMYPQFKDLHTRIVFTWEEDF